MCLTVLQQFITIDTNTNYFTYLLFFSEEHFIELHTHKIYNCVNPIAMVTMFLQKENMNVPQVELEVAEFPKSNGHNADRDRDQKVEIKLVTLDWSIATCYVLAVIVILIIDDSVMTVEYQYLGSTV